MGKRTSAIYTLRDLYKETCDALGFSPDPRQEEACAALQAFLASWHFGSSLGRWFRKQKAPLPLGVYICGNVGRGKTFLMDLCLRYLEKMKPDIFKKKYHFSLFMNQIHQEVYRGDGRALDDTIEDIGKGTSQLCLDEIEIRDIADATLFGHILRVYAKKNLPLIMTSNAHPTDLYKEGLHRERFLPTINFILEKFIIIVFSGPKDYREGISSQKTGGASPFSLDDGKSPDFSHIFATLTQGRPPKPLTCTSWGRDLSFPQYSQEVLWTSFPALCGKPFAAGDYAMLTQHIRILLLDDIPAYGQIDKNTMRRFIVLIDILYEAKIYLYIRSVEPVSAFCADPSWGFEGKRARSRLLEMQTWPNPTDLGIIA